MGSRTDQAEVVRRGLSVYVVPTDPETVEGGRGSSHIGGGSRLLARRHRLHGRDLQERAANRSILTRHKPGALPTITQVYVGVDRPPGGQWPGDELEKPDLVRPSVRLVPRSECCTDPRFVRLTLPYRAFWGIMSRQTLIGILPAKDFASLSAIMQTTVFIL